MAKILLGLVLTAGTLCLVFAGTLALTIRSLDLQVFDRYFVVLPKYLVVPGVGLLLMALVVWKTTVPR
jgi:hypothetical protein